MKKIIKGFILTLGFGLAGAAFATSSNANWETPYVSSIESNSTKPFVSVKADQSLSYANWEMPYVSSVKSDPKKLFTPVKTDGSLSYANWAAPYVLSIIK